MSVQLAFLCIFEPELVLMMQDTLHIVVQLLTLPRFLPKTVFAENFGNIRRKLDRILTWNALEPIMSCRGIFFSPFGSPYFRLIVTFQEQVGYHCCWIPLVWFYGTTKFVEQTGGQSWDSFNAMLCEFEAALGRFDPGLGNGGDGQLLLSVLTQKHRRWLLSCSRLRQGDQQVIGTHPSSSVYVEIALPCFYL